MPRQLFERLIRENHPEKFSWEKEICHKAILEDLDAKRIRGTIQTGVNVGRIPSSALQLQDVPAQLRRRSSSATTWLTPAPASSPRSCWRRPSGKPAPKPLPVIRAKPKPVCPGTSSAGAFSFPVFSVTLLLNYEIIATASTFFSSLCKILEQLAFTYKA